MGDYFGRDIFLDSYFFGKKQKNNQSQCDLVDLGIFGYLCFCFIKAGLCFKIIGIILANLQLKVLALLFGAKN